MTVGARRPRNFDDVLNRCSNVKLTGDGQATADCPVPGHKTPGGHLSLTNTLDRCLVTCHTRHTYEEIASALGFDSLTYVHDDAVQQRRIVAQYDYTDETGALLHQTVRFEPKGFAQRRPDGRGGWNWSLKDTRLVLFNLRAVLAAVKEQHTVYVVEGEKDALTLQRLGFLATTNAMGAGKWRPEYTDSLAGAHVVVIPDNDKPGQEHAAHVAASLRGKAASVKVLPLPFYCGHAVKDVTEWVEAGGTAADLEQAVSTTEAMSAEPQETETGLSLPLRTARQVCESEPERPEWVVEGLVAKKAITEVDAKVKDGKTTLTLAMVAAVVRGRAFLGLRTQPAPVIYLTEEGHASFSIELQRVGLRDSDSVLVLSRHDVRDQPWPEVARRAVHDARTLSAGVIVVDTLSRWARLQADDENNAGAAAAAMEPLEAARDAGLAVVMLRHDRKSGGDLGESARGSSAFSGSADIILGLRKAKTEGHPNRRSLEGNGRFEETPANLTIEFDFETGQYTSLGTTQAVERLDTMHKVMDLLPPKGGSPMLTSELQDALKPCPSSTLSHALRDLETAGEVLRVKGLGKNGKAHGFTRATGGG